MTCCPVLLHPHLRSATPLSGSLCLPLLLLDLLFSLVRVRLMPLSMLIVHCSKAAFIKMIKHSQTTAKYLKASGHGTWQVTTSHTNSPPSSSPPDLIFCSALGIYHSELVTGCCLMSHESLMRNYEPMKACDHRGRRNGPCPGTHALFPSPHRLLKAHSHPLHFKRGFSDTLFNHAGLDSQKMQISACCLSPSPQLSGFFEVAP